MMNDRDPSINKSHDDLDVAGFLSVITNIFRRIAQAIKAFFSGIVSLGVAILLLIRKRFLWILAGTTIGLACGFYIYVSRGPSYFSVLTARTNYNSARLLYNKIDYFNSLIKNRRHTELTAHFNISPKSADALLYFEIEPIVNDIEAARMFREEFLKSKHTPENRPDTMWARTMKFKDYKSQMTTYDYPVHEITLYSKDPDIYPNIQEGIIASMNSDSSLTFLRRESQQLQSQEDSLLSKSLADLDSLKRAYNSRLSRQPVVGGSEGTSVFMGDNDRNSPEIALYDKELMIKDELYALKAKKAQEAHVITIQSSFNKMGTAVSKFKESFTKYALAGFVTTLGFFILLEISNWLKRYEQKLQKQST